MDPRIEPDQQPSQLILVLLLPVVALQWFKTAGSSAQNLVLWLAGLLALACMFAWRARPQGQPWQALRRVIPLLVLAIALVGVWSMHPMAVIWLPVVMLLLFMYLPRREAQWISMAAICVCMAILQWHWQASGEVMGWVFLAEFATFLFLSQVARTIRRTSAELHQTNQQLRAVLEDFGALRQRELDRSREQMVVALTQLALYRDNETGQHVIRTRHFVESLARSLVAAGHYTQELTPERIDIIAKAAPMHDLGKIGVPDHVLLKPARHTPQETAQMQMHASIGESTLMIAAQGASSLHSLLQVAARIAGSHHEHWDGSGYPKGLKGPEIALEARLMALADVYDALTSPRVYKPRWTHEQAYQEIMAQSGSKFDPQVVAAFDRQQEEFRCIALKYQDAEDEVLA